MAGFGFCPGNIPQVAGCLSPQGSVKFYATIKAMWKWIKEAKIRCGKAPSK